MSSPAWQFQMGDPEALNAAPAATTAATAVSILAPVALAWLVQSRT